MAKRGDEGYVLHHHDERTGCRLGQCQTIEHLASAQPSERFNRTLRDIGKHGIGAAERDQGGFAEEHALLGENTVAAEQVP